MNSYNENLQNTVATTLQNQTLDLKGLNSQFKSSMYSLYYAEGATITAEEKLQSSKTDLENKGTVKEQAVKNMNISTNQLNSATLASQYNGQAVTNMATCASNVQIAATGITRLAADVGSIFSIVNAADFGSDIYNLTDQVKNLVNTTAYNAEFASQTAMEASAYTAQVSASTVLNDAKATNALMGNVLQVASGDYNTASQTYAADNATLATVNASEKLAEGTFTSADIDYVTGFSAYESVNLGLNQGITPIALAADTFLVVFNRLNAAFPPPLPASAASLPSNISPAPPSTTSAATKSGTTPPSTAPVVPNKNFDWYPVDSYYVFVVKESKQLTFTIAEAENLRINNPTSYVKITDQHPQASEIMLPKTETIARIINYNSVPVMSDTYKLTDTDGDAITPGTSYVVFVMAVYQDTYKRLINVFDDYLSAPSLSFTMTTLLNKAEYITVMPMSELVTLSPDEPGPVISKAFPKLAAVSAEINQIVTEGKAEDAEYILFLDAEPPADSKVKMGCDCIFLPVNIAVPEPLLTQPQLIDNIRSQVKTDQISLQTQRQIIQQCLKELTGVQNVKPAKQKGADNTDNAPVAVPNILTEYIGMLTTKLAELTPQTTTQTKFFFNKQLAEIIPAGNYTPATQISLTASAEKGASNTNLWYAFIGPATTDNFGNLLTGGAKYATAILTLSTSDDVALVQQYTDNISDFETVPIFSY